MSNGNNKLIIIDAQKMRSGYLKRLALNVKERYAKVWITAKLKE